jgi:PST family polysaccharide transporter
MIRHLPASIRSRLTGRPELLRIIDNLGWQFADKFLRMAIGLLVGVWLARYLGPGQFGLLNFGLAFVALFAPVASLGLRSLVLRDLVERPAERFVILGSSLTAQAVGALLVYAACLGSMHLLAPDNRLAVQIVAISGLSLLLKATDFVRHWFDSQVQSKYLVWADTVAVVIGSAAKVACILAGAGLMGFVWTGLAEALIAAGGLIAIYAWKVGHLKALAPNITVIKIQLREGWPLLLSAVAVMAYMRTDQLMIGYMLGEEELGIYSAALRISEAFYFVPLAVVTSAFPSIVAARGTSPALYEKRFEQLSRLLLRIAAAVSVAVTLLADWIIQTLYGPDYAGAGTVLAIHVWAGVFASLLVLSGQWMILEGMQRLVFIRSFAGLAINIALNGLLIPEFGIAGAAVATLCSQAFTGYLFDLSFARTRRMFWIKTKSLF